MSNKTAKALFTEFTAEHEALMRRVHGINDRINENRVEHARVMEDHDLAFLKNDVEAVALLRGKAEDLDKEYGWLSREAELLSRAGAKNSPILKDLGTKWYKAATAEAKALHKQWEDTVIKVHEAHLATLTATAELGQLGKECESLRHQYSTIIDATGFKLEWISLPNGEVDLNRQRGPFYLDTVVLAGVYKDGKL